MKPIEILINVIKTNKCPDKINCFDCPVHCWGYSKNWNTIDKQKKAKSMLKCYLFEKKVS